MNENAERMINILSPEIDRKCSEIKHARKEKMQSKLFVLICIAAIIIPTLFVFWGIRLTVLLIPVVFTGAAFLILSPILMNQQGGITYEQD